jgi:hypothetical protein
MLPVFSRFSLEDLRIVRPPWGVLLCATCLIVFVVIAFVTRPLNETGPIGAAMLFGIAAAGVGLALLRSWAWWFVVLASPVLAIGAAGILLECAGIHFGESGATDPTCSVRDVLEDVVFVVAGSAAFLYFLSSPVKTAFTTRGDSPSATPSFSLGCFVILGLIIGSIIGSIILAVLVAYVSCATGGECL